MELKQKRFQFFINKKMQLKTIVLSCIFFSQINLCNSQGLNNFWILGYTFSNGTNGNSIMNFDTLPVVPHKVDMNLNFLESNASICDMQGNLLFYTNGVKVKNRLGQTMLNGDSLNPGPYASSFQNAGLRIGQGQIIIPNPLDTNTYFLFHETIDFNGNTTRPFHLFYSTIDMTLDSGLGAVVQKNIALLSDTLITGGLTACKHANGRDWWLISHKNKSNQFYTHLITPNGIVNQNNQNIGSFLNTGGGGQSCISPNGKKYAFFHPLSGLDLFDFDRCIGVLSNWKHADSINGILGGLAFSLNSKQLYVSTEMQLYQFNISDTAQSLNNLKYLVASWDSTYSPAPPFATTFYLAQLAPDNKIYISGGNGVPILHVINYPDSIGAACNFIQHAINLPTVNAFTIPNYPNYFLGADSGSVCDTLMLGIKQDETEFNYGNNVRLSPNPAQNYFNVNFNFVSNNKTPFILYSSFGSEVDRMDIGKEQSPYFVKTDRLKNGIYFWKFENQSGRITIIK